MAKKPKYNDEHRQLNGHSLEPLNGYTSKRTIVSAEMAYFCFETLLKHLKRESSHHSSGLLTFTNDRYPLFVSWHMGKEHHLRGCIGTFTPLNLHQGLKEYAVTSATKDSRFTPVHLDEVHKLTVSVSVLVNFEEANDYLDWELGTHGVRIEFVNDRNHHKTATYLPHVATEQGWNKMQAIDSLLRKGGHKGQISQQLRTSIKLVRYQSEKVELSYNDYTAFLGSKRDGRAGIPSGQHNGNI